MRQGHAEGQAVKPKPASQEPKAAVTREGGKNAKVIELLKQPNGATLADIMEATD